MPTNADPHRVVILVEEETHERVYIAQHLAENGFGERTLASYAVGDGALFIRTEMNLYRVEQQKP